MQVHALQTALNLDWVQRLEFQQIVYMHAVPWDWMNYAHTNTTSLEMDSGNKSIPPYPAHTKFQSK